MKNRYFIVPVLALICLVPGCIELYGYPVSGVEFSPDSFTQRSFRYYRSPFTGTIRGKRILMPKESNCQSLIALNLIPANGTAKTRWDLVSESFQTSDVLSADFDARFLTEYLDYSTDQWNRDNVEKAEILWPQIALLVRERLYLQLPPLFHFAINCPQETSNEQFEKLLNRELAKAWLQAAKITAARAQSYADSDSDSDSDSKTNPVQGPQLDPVQGPLQEPASLEDANRFVEKAIEFDPTYKDAIQLEMPLKW